jgi:hypothetical protein
MLADVVHRVFREEFGTRSAELLVGILPPPRTARCRSLGTVPLNHQ